MGKEILEKLEPIPLEWLTDSRLLDIACIIDNEYRQYRYLARHFVVKNEHGYISLKTNICDSACFIRIYFNSELFVTEIKILGEFTDGWDSIQPATITRINQYYNQL